jgi:hypothetical protein
MKHTPKDEEALIEFLHTPAIKDNLYNFVMAVYPWGVPGTPLEGVHGPRQWQQEDLDELSAHVAAQQAVVAAGGIPLMFKKATAAGRGPGKSAKIAWLVHWMLTTRLGSTVIVTANTEEQLKTKTFAEVSKWMNLSINAHWFDVSVLSVKPAEWFGTLLKTQLHIDTGYYYGRGQLWSEENPDAFAGTHNPQGVMVLFDEASGIPDTIFTVTRFFFTEPVVDRYWLVDSNPRRNSGGFFEVFHGINGVADPTWRKRHLDIRTVEGMDPKIAQALIDQHGIDSDPVRMEVLGEFPKQGSRQFIGNELVYGAQQRALETDPSAPLLMGVDVARFGDDQTVIRFRRGRDARSIPAIRYTQRDNMFVANELARIIDRFTPDAVNIDVGNASGVIDRLREQHYRVHEINFGTSSSDPHYYLKRTEMWAALRDWLPGGMIETDPRLFTDLTAPEYDFHGKAKEMIMLETKDAMRSRGHRSPDDGDALALTFATRVARRDLAVSQGRGRGRVARDLDYRLFSD